MHALLACVYQEWNFIFKFSNFHIYFLSHPYLICILACCACRVVVRQCTEYKELPACRGNRLFMMKRRQFCVSQ